MKKALPIIASILLLLGSASCAQIIHMPQPHACLYCHEAQPKGVRPALINPDINTLCSACHADRISSGEHRVDVKPTVDTKGLPLSANGKMTCSTCHEPHGLVGHAKLLRMNSAQLCLTCHNK